LVVDATAYRGKAVRLRAMLANAEVTTGSSMSIGAYGKELQQPLAAVARSDITFAVPQNAQTLDIQFLISLSPTT
jgi:hypothetical protein